MIIYALKFTLCLAFLLVFYKLVLERENMHVFKRFFLLGGLFFAAFVPVLTYEVMSEETMATTTNEMLADMLVLPIDPIVHETTIWQNIGIGVYGLICLVLFIRFMVGVRSFVQKRQEGTPIIWQNITLVLLPNQVLPHSFMDTIYVAKCDYDSGKITNDLLRHEGVHVRQKHSWDIVLIELLQITFWWNPVLWWYKKAIQLNHEFLADGVVIQQTEVTAYQRLLLSQVSQQKNYLASSIYYLTTKKRLEMMVKETSKHGARLRKLLVLPLVCALFFAFSNQVVAQTQGASIEEVKEYKELVKSCMDEEGKMWRITKETATKANLLFSKMSAEQQMAMKKKGLYLPPPPPPAPKSDCRVPPPPPPPPAPPVKKQEH